MTQNTKMLLDEWTLTEQGRKKVGIAAGIMKNCVYEEVEKKVKEGWKFMEFGTVKYDTCNTTGEYVLFKDGEISWNNIGLRSIGFHQFLKNYKKCRQMLRDAEVEVNISLNADHISQYEEMAKELLKFKEVRIIINHWCPNTISRPPDYLDMETTVQEIVDGCFPQSSYWNEKLRKKAIARKLGFKIPYLPKIPIFAWECDSGQYYRWYHAFKQNHVAYIIVANSMYCLQACGSIGGKGISSDSERMLRRFLSMRNKYPDDGYYMKLVSCGGIMGLDDITSRFYRGADAVQICTAVLAGKTHRNLTYSLDKQHNDYED